MIFTTEDPAQASNRTAGAVAPLRPAKTMLEQAATYHLMALKLLIPVMGLSLHCWQCSMM